MLREDLIYKDEYYKIVGVLIQIFKDLGGELLEKHYQKAVSIGLKLAGIDFTEQYPIKLYYAGNFIGIYYADFLVKIGEAKIILEIKKHENFGMKNIKQLNDYIKLEHIKLGILANFTRTGVVCKRMVNL